MAKDKLITIRIESEKLEAFKKWTEKRDLNLSTFLYEIVDACLDGRLDERIVKDSQLDDNRIDEIIEKRLDGVPLREELETAIASLRTYFDDVAATVASHDEVIQKRLMDDSHRATLKVMDENSITELVGK